MSTLRTRAGKGSELSHNELDANFKRTVSQKTTTYLCLVGDNRDVIECVHATVPFTVTLGDANTMDAAETGDYEITIVNIGAAVITVARAGSDTIDGAATSLTLNQYDSVTLKVISAGTGYSTLTQSPRLRFKVIDIGDWDMDATAAVQIAHGLTLANIRSTQIRIRNDADTIYYPLEYGSSNAGYHLAISTTVNLTRIGAGLFDGTDFDSTSYNRGWITIGYTQ